MICNVTICDDDIPGTIFDSIRWVRFEQASLVLVSGFGAGDLLDGAWRGAWIVERGWA